MRDRTNLSRRRFVQATGAAAGSFAMVGVAAGAPGNGTDRREYVVGVTGTESDATGYVKNHLTGKQEVTGAVETLNAVVVRLPENAADSAHENFVDRLEREDAVKYVEENESLHAQVVPNDPQYDEQYADQMVNANDAWDVTYGSGSVTVGVVDQGVKYDHADLNDNMDDSVSNHGYDFVDDDADPYPVDLSTEYHGTHVSGIAAAEIDNGEGVTGIGRSSVLSGRALDQEGSGTVSNIADAITWATDRGVEVINLSLGGGGYTQTMKDAVSYAYDNGVLVVAAAGNDGQSSVSYPAQYDECLAVSALDPDGTLASYSNYGDDIELAAPGTNVLSTWTTSDRYNSISGTSMATPVVSGVAGLALAQYDLTNVELRTHLKATAVDMGLSENEQGAGRVDAANAVQTEPGSGGGTESTSGSVTDTLTSYADADCWTWAWTYSDPSTVVVELDGPADADFDLYVNDGEAACPTPSGYDYRSYSTDSQESITIDDPDTSTDLHVTVDSYSGDGEYTLTITEYK